VEGHAVEDWLQSRIGSSLATLAQVKKTTTSSMSSMARNLVQIFIYLLLPTG